MTELILLDMLIFSEEQKIKHKAECSRILRLDKDRKDRKELEIAMTLYSYETRD